MKSNNKHKEVSSVEKRSRHLQQVMFGIMAGIIILSMILSLAIH